MLRREVVSCGSSVGGLAELGEGLGVVAVGEVEQAGGAVGHGAVRARVERLLREERRRLLLALGQVRERELGEGRRVRRLADEHLARLGDGLVDLPALAQRGDVQRARVDRVRVVLHEVGQPVGRLLLLAAPAPHLGQRDGDSCESGASLAAIASCSSAPPEIARVARGRAEVVARLPQVRVERDGLAAAATPRAPAARPSRPARPAPSCRRPADSPAAAPPSRPPLRRARLPALRTRRARKRRSTGRSEDRKDERDFFSQLPTFRSSCEPSRSHRVAAGVDDHSFRPSRLPVFL